MEKLASLLSPHTLETPEVLRQLTLAHRYLGEFKGACQSMPNQAILLNTLALQEAQDSSQIENIITTQDALYKYTLSPTSHNPATKEVVNYNEALQFLFQELKKHNLLTLRAIVAAQQIIIGNDAGIRTQQGTALINEQSGKIIYTPPPPHEINDLLSDLEQYINNQFHTQLDPIIRMAIIHHQFESIHPFYDGNGRIGRIINIMYLVKEGLLEIPILYLSRYINHNKANYYRLLQERRDTHDWQSYLLFMVKAVAQTAASAIDTVSKIKALQQECKEIIRSEHGKIYSQDLINNIFTHPYTKIQFLQQELKVSRVTAAKYLDQLAAARLLNKQKLGKENYYINAKLVAILTQTPSLRDG